MKTIIHLLSNTKNQLLIVGLGVSMFIIVQYKDQPLVPSFQRTYEIAFLNELPENSCGESNLKNANFLTAFFNSLVSEHKIKEETPVCYERFKRQRRSFLDFISASK